LIKEKSYILPLQPEQKSRQKILRYDFINIFEKYQALVVNFLALDYDFMLKKLYSLVDYIPNNLRALIIQMPENANYVDQYFAKKI